MAERQGPLPEHCAGAALLSCAACAVHLTQRSDGGAVGSQRTPAARNCPPRTRTPLQARPPALPCRPGRPAARPAPCRLRCASILPTQSNLESMDSGALPSGMPSASSHVPPWPLNCSSTRVVRPMSIATIGPKRQGLQHGEHGNSSLRILPEARVSCTLHID